jgi:hypothetical protein
MRWRSIRRANRPTAATISGQTAIAADSPRPPTSECRKSERARHRHEDAVDDPEDDRDRTAYGAPQPCPVAATND